MFMELDAAILQYVKSQLGATNFATFEAMFNTPEQPSGATTLLNTLYKQNCGNLNGLMADMLSAIKDSLGGGASVLGRIKIGPIELENYISTIDGKIANFRKLARANNGDGDGACGTGVVKGGFTGSIPYTGTW